MSEGRTVRNPLAPKACPVLKRCKDLPTPARRDLMAEMVKSAFKVLADPNAVARLITDHILPTLRRSASHFAIARSLSH